MQTYLPAGDRLPTTILHAFDSTFTQIEGFVDTLAYLGYTHIQIPPAQKSNDAGGAWYGRYQPIDYSVIEGRGTEEELRSLTGRAHACGIRVIADVVFNHMADIAPYYDKTTGKLDFPGLVQEDFHPKTEIHYGDGNRDSEVVGWLNGDLPDLNHDRPEVMRIQKEHLSKLIASGVDGFRFDAAKNMSHDALRAFVDHIDEETQRAAWNYLEVIEDSDSPGESFKDIAAITDYRLYYTIREAFSFGGDLKKLRVPLGLDDERSVVFGINHDTDPSNYDHPLDLAYADRDDSLLATAYVLAREKGVPLVLEKDNRTMFIQAGVKFRQLMRERLNPVEHVLAVVDSETLLMMERGCEGLFIVNKSPEAFDAPMLDVTDTHLEGRYRELRYGFHMTVERQDDGRKFVRHYGDDDREGMHVAAREALYFVRD